MTGLPFAVILTKRGEEILVDINDFERLTHVSWCISKRGYPTAGTQMRGKTVRMYMHHAILGRPLGKMVVDHINANKLDNRKSNLRFCMQHENCANGPIKKNNTSGHTGVWFHRKGGYWCAEIKFKRKKICLGSFAKIEDAIAARLKAEVRIWGEFSPRHGAQKETA